MPLAHRRARPWTIVTAPLPQAARRSSTPASTPPTPMPAFNTNPATCAYAEHETYHGLREQARLGRQREIEALLMTRAARRKTGNGSTHSADSAARTHTRAHHPIL